MSEGQGHYAGAGGQGAIPPPGPYPQSGPYTGPNPYAQPQPYPQPQPYGPAAGPYGHPQSYPQPQPYAGPNPYARPLPPQPAPAGLAAPAAASFDGGFPGPRPRRSRIAVLLQFTLQWIYAPAWIAALVALFAILLWTGAGGPSGPESDSWLKVNRTFVPPRRLKAELTGRPEDWERYVGRILERRIRLAEAGYAAGDGDVEADFGRTVGVKLAVRLYRGLGAAGVVRLAERYGWQGVPAGGDLARVRLTRRYPAPPRVSAPGPQDPPAAPGTPWGARPGRSAFLLPFMLVLQIAYVPVCGVLSLLAFWVKHPEPDYWDRWGARWAVGPRAFRAEFTGSAAAWDRHVRRIVAREVRPGNGKGAEAPRRIRVNLATYRGAGAQHVLRVAAEQGYVLDPAYLPDPGVCVRLYRPDRQV
ncbi:hypothetical protein ACIF6L_03340 [Kitasatospora sp. NPDC086009]|uniref:hypothetical protein n=1 Tax=unclassified Kitasatospora TaxID=2633591 RepID=UPI0037CA8107